MLNHLNPPGALGLCFLKAKAELIPEWNLAFFGTGSAWKVTGSAQTELSSRVTWQCGEGNS